VVVRKGRANASPKPLREFSGRITRRPALLNRFFASFRPRSVDPHGDGSLRDRQPVQQLSSQTGVLNCEGDCLGRINRPDSCSG
jgi:hypothetical protein